MSMGQQTRVGKICPEHGQHHGGGEVEQKSVKNITGACAYSILLEQVLWRGAFLTGVRLQILQPLNTVLN